MSPLCGPFKRQLSSLKAAYLHHPFSRVGREGRLRFIHARASTYVIFEGATDICIHMYMYFTTLQQSYTYVTRGG